MVTIEQVSSHEIEIVPSTSFPEIGPTTSSSDPSRRPREVRLARPKTPSSASVFSDGQLTDGDGDRNLSGWPARGEEDEDEDPHARRPADVAFKQQRMKSWQPLLDPWWVIASYLLVGACFLPAGVVIRRQSDALVEMRAVYESHLADGTAADVTGCEIGNNPNAMYKDGRRTCRIQLTVPDDGGDLDPPVLVHYELDNFYQNYKKYMQSFDQSQLLGSLTQDSVSAMECKPLNEIGGVKINPCGLIANTLFNDVITLESIVTPDGTVLDGAPLVETGIAWQSDLEWKFRQPEGFRYEECPEGQECDCSQLGSDGERLWSCAEPYQDVDGRTFRYYYPDDETTQYLYETYPMVVSPIDGVMNEHFVVWMRVTALPKFRKLYGYIEQTIPAGSTLTFAIEANYAVERMRGAKALVVANTYAFGTKNHWLGTLFIVAGGMAASFGLLFAAKMVLSPRKFADRSYLRFKED